MSEIPMHKVLLGTNIRVLSDVDELNYFAKQSVILPKQMTPLQAWDLLMDHPMPVLKLAFRLRDAISSRFGVRRIGGFSRKREGLPKIGEKLDFFTVESLSDDCLSLSERDKHLDVLTCITTNGPELTITSSVQTHNLFGKAYMIPVGPAHKLIVRQMLNRLKRILEA